MEKSKEEKTIPKSIVFLEAGIIFHDLLSYSGKISKTINWDRNFEDGLKISTWVYLQVRSDSKNSSANNQINIRASD